jgi:hypothetical protein
VIFVVDSEKKPEAGRNPNADWARKPSKVIQI